MMNNRNSKSSDASMPSGMNVSIGDRDYGDFSMCNSAILLRGTKTGAQKGDLARFTVSMRNASKVVWSEFEGVVVRVGTNEIVLDIDGDTSAWHDFVEKHAPH
jgi:hypothetical protein